MRFPAGSIGELLSSAESRGMTPMEAFIEALAQMENKQVGDSEHDDDPDT